MSCGQDNRGALHTFSISFAFAYSQVRSSTMSKQSLEEAVKLRNTAAYNLKVSVLSTVGEEHGERIRHWFETKKAGWYAVLEDPRMPAMSTVLDQAHNAMDRKLFAMKGFHHPGGSQAAFLTGLAHLYNLIPYQRRALNAGKCGVEVEGGVLPTSDWLLNLQILTSGGYQCGAQTPYHEIRGNVEFLAC